MADPMVTQILNMSLSEMNPLLRQRVGRIMGMVDTYRGSHPAVELASGGDMAGRRFFAWHANAHADGVISVYGGRGSGKTTLLMNVCAQLLRNTGARTGDLVLPPILPERFGPSETLAGWLLASLRLWLEDDSSLAQQTLRWLPKTGDRHPEQVGLVNRDDPGMTVLDYVDFLREQEALFSHRFARGLAEQNLWTQEYGREAMKLLDADTAFVRHWDRLVRGLLGSRGDHPLLVVMIDDADLNPEALPGIIQQLRLLAHPNVLFLFSADRKTLATSMMVRELSGYGSDGLDEHAGGQARRFMIECGEMTSDSLRQSINVRLLKTLPRHFSLEIPSLSDHDCLSYRPLARPRSRMFIELLEQFRLDQPGGHPFMASLADYFDYSRRICVGCCPKDGKESGPVPCEYREAGTGRPERCPMEPREECSKGKCSWGGVRPEWSEKTMIPAPTAAMLPDTVRGMEQLYLRLEALAKPLETLEAKDGRRREIFAEAAQAILVFAMDYYDNRFGHSRRVEFGDFREDLGEWERTSGDPQRSVCPIRINLDDFSLAPVTSHKIPVSTYSVDQPVEGRLYLSRMERISGYLAPEEKAKGRRVGDVDDRLIQALLFAVDLSGPMQIFRSPTGESLTDVLMTRRPIGEALGLCSYTNLNNGVQVAHFIWLVPRWPKAIDLSVFGIGWNRLLRAMLRQGPRGEFRGNLFWVRHLMVVACIQAGRCLPPEALWAQPLGDDSNPVMLLREVMVKLGRLFSHAVDEDVDGKGHPRRQAFIGWFNRRLPLFALSWHLSEKLAVQLLTSWLVILTSCRESHQRFFGMLMDNAHFSDISFSIDLLSIWGKPDGEIWKPRLPIPGPDFPDEKGELKVVERKMVDEVGEENPSIRYFLQQLDMVPEMAQRKILWVLTKSPIKNLIRIARYFGMESDKAASRHLEKIGELSLHNIYLIFRMMTKSDANKVIPFEMLKKVTRLGVMVNPEEAPDRGLDAESYVALRRAQRLVAFLHRELRGLLQDLGIPGGVNSMSNILVAETFQQAYKRAATDKNKTDRQPREDDSSTVVPQLSEWDRQFVVFSRAVAKALRELRNCPAWEDLLPEAKREGFRKFWMEFDMEFDLEKLAGAMDTYIDCYEYEP